MQSVHIVAGVPGSGKTWVCKQLADKFDYVPHDDFPVDQYYKAILRIARYSDRPVLAEAPFRVTILAEQLIKAGANVKLHWIIESPETTKARYEARDSKPIPPQHLKNLARYAARERDAGTSEQILLRLKAL